MASSAVLTGVSCWLVLVLRVFGSFFLRSMDDEVLIEEVEEDCRFCMSMHPYIYPSPYRLVNLYADWCVYSRHGFFCNLAGICFTKVKMVST
ncbi:unnamed protein product [Macrosiphum euphorbiae]|uniref:Secreted protein n=1 Tax=Macrosiphum euphorbiae TaxID=13131 RepID=A0AAV0X2W9_9HEMI|nr:unnamed protein product [Macrosiphum euphorbiae]